MQRIPEPELMDEEIQARAYAEADFSGPHEQFVALFRACFPGLEPTGAVLDLGCGPADVSIRFARAYPGCRIDGVDGAPAMLRFGREAVLRAGLESRIRLVEAYLPGAVLPLESYDAVISNSLLHHLADPRVLWDSLKRWGKPGAPVFIMDLLRPDDSARVERLVRQYAGDEPDILQRDFRHSLHAAYRPDEVLDQLRAANLDGFDLRLASDRHFVVFGRLGD